MSCVPSTGLYLADLDTPATKRLAADTKARCGKVVAERELKVPQSDLNEGQVAELITRRGGVALDCAEAALGYVDQVAIVHKAVRSNRGRR